MVFEQVCLFILYANELKCVVSRFTLKILFTPNRICHSLSLLHINVFLVSQNPIVIMSIWLGYILCLLKHNCYVCKPSLPHLPVVGWDYVLEPPITFIWVQGSGTQVISFMGQALWNVLVARSIHCQRG